MKQLNLFDSGGTRVVPTGLFEHWPNICQPPANHWPDRPNDLPAIDQPLANHWPTVGQPWPTIGQPLANRGAGTQKKTRPCHPRGPKHFLPPAEVGRRLRVHGTQAFYCGLSRQKLILLSIFVYLF